MSLDFMLGFTVKVSEDRETFLLLEEWVGEWPSGKQINTNYTNNVIPMWKEAGCYDALYRSSGKLAKEILPELGKAWQDMLNNPEKYKAMNPSNNWGDYHGALAFLEGIMEWCAYYPLAEIHTSS